MNTTNHQILVKAVGKNVKIHCAFTTAPEDAEPLEVDWNVKSIRYPMEKKEVFLYTIEHIYTGYYKSVKGRAYF